jgi:hypothetical protein
MDDGRIVRVTRPDESAEPSGDAASRSLFQESYA